MATSQQYSLRWNNYLRHITYAFDNLRSQDDFVDVTLCCDGRKIKAHKVLLSACSGYFKEIFKENPCPHPVIIFKFIKYEDLLAIVEFMYQGEVNVQQDALQSFLQTAELLAVQGLTAEEKEKPKAPKSPVNRVLDEHMIKTIPSTIRTVTENNTQTSTIEIEANVLPNIKKRKITFSDDDEMYTETVQFPKEEPTIKTTEMEYIPSVKMGIPEYIDVAESNQLAESAQQNQQSSQDTTTQTQFTSEYEILTESEIDEKYQTNDVTETTEIATVEMRQIFTTQPSRESNQDTKVNNSQDLASSKWTECQFCKMVITTVNLWRHIRTQHTPEPPRTCEICQKKFKNKYSLREHIRISHEQKQSKISNKIN